MYQLVYKSISREHFDVNDLVRILEKAHAFNYRFDLTGVLLFNGTEFLQLLEGPEEHVKMLYESIILPDAKHHSCELILEVRDGQRVFPQWKMGFYHMRMLDNLFLDGLISASMNDLVHTLEHEPNQIKKILLHFIKQNEKSLRNI
jgi:hypothetical protein